MKVLKLGLHHKEEKLKCLSVPVLRAMEVSSTSTSCDRVNSSTSMATAAQILVVVNTYSSER